MSDALKNDVPWSNNSNAPNITSSLYFGEKVNFVGDSIAAILYGIIIVLFFHCMAALLDPINRTRGGIAWGLVAHTAVMFSFVTIATAMGLNLLSISRIDNRDFPGVNGVLPPGPFGYKYLIYDRAISIVPNLMFQLNQWLADGLLLHRCYIICSMNKWVIAFPCLMYLTSLVMGILYIWQDSRPVVLNDANRNFGTPYFTVSITLNVLLTLVIVTRLILHIRNIRGALGETGRSYRTVVTMLIESSALYAVSFLLFIVPYAASSWLGSTFWPILNETQVIAPFLIIRRVANRRALTSDTLASGATSSIDFNSLRTSTSENVTIPDGDWITSMGAQGETLDGLGAGTKTTTSGVSL